METGAAPIGCLNSACCWAVSMEITITDSVTAHQVVDGEGMIGCRDRRCKWQGGTISAEELADMRDGGDAERCRVKKGGHEGIRCGGIPGTLQWRHFYIPESQEPEDFSLKVPHHCRRLLAFREAGRVCAQLYAASLSLSCRSLLHMRARMLFSLM